MANTTILIGCAVFWHHLNLIVVMHFARTDAQAIIANGQLLSSSEYRASSRICPVFFVMASGFVDIPERLGRGYMEQDHANSIRIDPDEWRE